MVAEGGRESAFSRDETLIGFRPHTVERGHGGKPALGSQKQEDEKFKNRG